MQFNHSFFAFYQRPVEQFNSILTKFVARSTEVQKHVLATLRVLKKRFPTLVGPVNQILEENGEQLEVEPEVDQKPSLKAERIDSAPNLSREATPEIPEEVDPLVAFALPETESFRELCVSGRGIVLQTPHLQIGMILERSGGTIIHLYYSNLSEQSLNSLSVSVNNPDVDSLEFCAEAAPASIEAQQQVTQTIWVVCNKEFLGAPRLLVNYDVGDANFTFESVLPISAGTFLQPFLVNEADFSTAWDAVKGQPNEQQVSWISLDLTMERALGIMKAMRFYLIAPITEHTLRFACQFTCLAIQVSAKTLFITLWFYI